MNWTKLQIHILEPSFSLYQRVICTSNNIRELSLQFQSNITGKTVISSKVSSKYNNATRGSVPVHWIKVSVLIAKALMKSGLSIKSSIPSTKIIVQIEITLNQMLILLHHQSQRIDESTLFGIAPKKG